MVDPLKNFGFLLFVIILFAGTCSCNYKESNGSIGVGEIIHPTGDNIPDESLLSAMITKNDNKENSDEFLELKTRLSSTKEILDIGKLEGEKYEMFGVVEKVLIYRENIYVLDSRINEIKVFNSNGEYLQTIGQSGRGPGEFGAAEDMFIDNNNGSLFVLDRYMKVEIFNFSDSLDGFEYTNSLFLESYALSFCPLDSMIIVPDITRSKQDLFSVYNKGGMLKTSFGDMYKSNNPLVRVNLSRGLVLCSEEEGVIISAFFNFPFLHAYSDGGDLLWVSKIDSFDIRRIVERDQGNTIAYSSALSEPYHPYHIFENLVLLSEKYAIAQIGDRTRQSPRSYAKLDSYLISIPSGEGQYIDADLPFISSATDSLLLAKYSKPYPHVTILSY